jgi:hypothetical protein
MRFSAYCCGICCSYDTPVPGAGEHEKLPPVGPVVALVEHLLQEFELVADLPAVNASGVDDTPDGITFLVVEFVELLLVRALSLTRGDPRFNAQQVCIGLIEVIRLVRA